MLIFTAALCRWRKLGSTDSLRFPDSGACLTWFSGKVTDGIDTRTLNNLEQNLTQYFFPIHDFVFQWAAPSAILRNKTASYYAVKLRYRIRTQPSHHM